MADIATWTANGNRNRPNICAGVHGAGCEKHSISRIESALIFMTGMGSKFVRRETTYSRVVAGSTQAVIFSTHSRKWRGGRKEGVLHGRYPLGFASAVPVERCGGQAETPSAQS